MRVVLIRHGRSSHVHAGWIDLAGFHRWRETYEAAGIVAGDVPPDPLRALAGGSTLVVASDTRRAIESAKVLAPEREVVTSPLLRELDLLPLGIARIRLPLFGWALLVGLRSLMHAESASERARIDAAARAVEQWAREHGSVAIVTHASLRKRLGRELIARGWRLEARAGGLRNWSTWSLARD